MRNLLIIIFAFSSLSFAQLLGPKLVTQQDEYDFGDIKQGDKVTHVFVITNSGGDLLKITNVKASCGCTAALPEKDELAPGESTNLNVTFNSAGRFGKQKKLIRIESNDPDNPQVIVTIKGNVVLSDDESSSYPILHFDQTKYNFGIVKEGKVVEYTFNFENSGNSTLKIKDIKTSCGCTAALVSSEVLKPGEQGTIKVELDTSNRKGKMSRTITIKSNDPKDPTKILTIYADIQQ
ncbi:MAG: DUF1573 domain-containing protein [Ignavibacteria bacterium]|nr:MAG: DUF1573 domain-containing protein [Ignavibacteria bacterium]